MGSARHEERRTAQTAGERLDVFAAREFSVSRAAAQRAIEEERVLVAGEPAKANRRLRAGEEVTLICEPPQQTDIVPEDIPIDIIHEDGDIAIIDKPQGMVVHPAPGNYTGTLVNALMFRLSGLSGIGGELRPGIVHRIDKLTSGLIAVAKNDAAHISLSAQLREHTMRRMYIAIVSGNIREDEGVVDAAIARHHTDRKRMSVADDGREAVTHWRVLERYGAYTLLLAVLETGRTHQIRVHMAHIKHPVAGDTVYGSSRPALGLAGQALHAARLELDHPSTGERMRFAAPVPQYFKAALVRAGRTHEYGELEAALRAALREV